MTETTPNVHTIRVQVDAVAAGADGSFVAGESPFAGTVTRAAYIPSAAITGANTNTRTVKVTNRAADGTGTNVPATITFTSGVNAAADDAKELTVSGTPATVTVAQGDVLSVDSVHAASGLADPGGVLVIELTRS